MRLYLKLGQSPQGTSHFLSWWQLSRDKPNITTIHKVMPHLRASQTKPGTIWSHFFLKVLMTVSDWHCVFLVNRKKNTYVNHKSLMAYYCQENKDGIKHLAIHRCPSESPGLAEACPQLPAPVSWPPQPLLVSDSPSQVHDDKFSPFSNLLFLWANRQLTGKYSKTESTTSDSLGSSALWHVFTQ